MTEAEFRALAAQGYNRIPLVLESFAGPRHAAVALPQARQPALHLSPESVVGGERFGRYSFIGLPARIRIRARGRDIEVEDRGGIAERHHGDPLDFIAAFQRRYRVAPRPGLPRFCGGLAGYFGYDTVRHIEPKLADRGPPAQPGIDELPDILLLLTEELAVVDNLSGKIILIVYADPQEPNAYWNARDRLQTLRRKLRQPVEIPFQVATKVTEAHSEFGAERYQAAVARAKEYVAAGDIMQVVIAQRMRMPFAASPLSLYRALRSLNPSPYMFYYDFGDFHVVGASPEILVRKEGDSDHAAPDRRHAAARRDARGRRDTGDRTARRSQGDRRARDAGRSRAQRRRPRRADRHRPGHRPDGDRALLARDAHRVERRGHVEAGADQHRRAARGVSRRHGQRRAEGAGDGDHRRTRTLRRGVYAGAVGYISFQDDMDAAIALRTAVLKDGTLYAQAGAGIVHDSVPESNGRRPCTRCAPCCAPLKWSSRDSTPKRSPACVCARAGCARHLRVIELHRAAHHEQCAQRRHPSPRCPEALLCGIYFS